MAELDLVIRSGTRRAYLSKNLSAFCTERTMAWASSLMA
jgi:hypothetical protein